MLEIMKRVKELEKQQMNMLDEIDKTYWRKILVREAVEGRGDMHRCSANCCENQSYNAESYQNCLDNCNMAPIAVNQFIESEATRSQIHWEQCESSCQVGKEDQQKFKSCIFKCLDAQTDVLNAMFSNIKKTLGNQQRNEQT